MPGFGGFTFVHEHTGPAVNVAPFINEGVNQQNAATGNDDVQVNAVVVIGIIPPEHHYPDGNA